ncbi:AMP-binding protein [Streptomyces sp. NPDC089919]|uniref:class I adenylate-forming enzyme family protein n=1 Tax=Streptomyces sp. NPDC089919 TaxID=3155188 RepID=UPI003415FC1D
MTTTPPPPSGSSAQDERRAPDAPFESYVDVLLATLARRPDRVVLTSDDRTLTGGEVGEGVARAAGVLARRGVGPGTTVALRTGNRPEALLARYAANLLGARVLHLGDDLPAARQAQLLADTGAVLLLTDPDGEPAPAPAVLALDRALFTAGPLPAPVPAAVRPGDDWCLRLTGGTTGPPKAVRLGHGAYRLMLAGLTAGLPADGSVRLLSCTSLAHLAGIFADAALLAGGSVVVQPRFDPAEVHAALDRQEITDLWLLPPLLYELLDHPRPAGARPPALRRLYYGGTPAAPGRLRQAAEVFGPVLHGSYGQTETGPIAGVGPDEHGVTGPDGRITAGRPLPGVGVEIRDPAGAVRPPGRDGEVHVRSAMAMNGYWGRTGTAAGLPADGWIATGDVGRLDGAGYLHLVDRLREIVVVVGGHLHPAEAEQVLLGDPEVAQCAAYGTTGPDGTEELHAAVRPAPGRRPDPGRLAGLVAERLGSLYAGTRIRLVDALPLTPAGKPDKARLRAGG